MPAAANVFVALGPRLPVMTAWTLALATIWAAWTPAPPAAAADGLSSTSKSPDAESTTIKNGQRPNRGSSGASRSRPDDEIAIFMMPPFTVFLFEDFQDVWETELSIYSKIDYNNTDSISTFSLKKQFGQGAGAKIRTADIPGFQSDGMAKRKQKWGLDHGAAQW
jgi:hypothetical protein